jgi:DinB superfamily
MELKEYIQLQVARGRSLLDSALADTPQEMVNQKGGEHLNTIAAVYSHVIGGEDYFVNVAILGNKSRLWESQGWAEKLGMSAEIGRNWGITIPDLAAFQTYVATVRAATDAYVATVTPAELDRLVQIFNNERPVANVLTILAIHTAGHGGEIATIKAALGMKGLPF